VFATPGEEVRNEESLGVWFGVLNGVADGVKWVLDDGELVVEEAGCTDSRRESETVVVEMGVLGVTTFAVVSVDFAVSDGVEGAPNLRKRICLSSSAVG